MSNEPSIGVSGAGRNCARDRCVPSKRIKAAYRSTGTARFGSLLQYARAIAALNTPESAVAQRWLAARR